MYGTAAGVQAWLKTILTIGASSPVTTTETTDELTALSAVIDGKLDAAGYTVPITDADGLKVLNRCANMIVACRVYQRLVIGREPNPTTMDAAQSWCKEAQGILDDVYSGALTLGAAAVASATAGMPQVSSNASVLPYVDTTEDFVEDWGPEETND